MNTVISDIAVGAREQATGLQQVNTAINQMDQGTQQSAAMAEEFEHLKQTVFPPLLDAARRGGWVRIWSAGCATHNAPLQVGRVYLAPGSVAHLEVAGRPGRAALSSDGR
jgi:hypothetical protein